MMLRRGLWEIYERSGDGKIDFVPSKNSSISSTFLCCYGAILSTVIVTYTRVSLKFMHHQGKHETKKAVYKNAISRLICGVMFMIKNLSHHGRLGV